jgi:sulfite reductase (NADPH) hemoprotein beta-component
MYQYDDYDRALVTERVAQFRDQVERYQAGHLSEDEFLPLRLQNGLYLQKHAYMLRVAIPYGVLSANQLRALAQVSDRFDKGYGHFTTRQNIQFNWVKLPEVPDLLAYLAEHDMHAIQTSGNVVRNVTTEAFAGVAADEVYDPRIFAEIIRQWSTINPEFLFLPRKFKIAVSASEEDRAAVRIHDVGLYLFSR